MCYFIAIGFDRELAPEFERRLRCRRPAPRYVARSFAATNEVRILDVGHCACDFFNDSMGIDAGIAATISSAVNAIGSARLLVFWDEGEGTAVSGGGEVSTYDFLASRPNLIEGQARTLTPDHRLRDRARAAGFATEEPGTRTRKRKGR